MTDIQREVRVSEIYYERQQAGRATPVRSVHTAAGLVYVPLSPENSDFQPIERETKRTIRRHVRCTDGREGIEVVEEYDVVYGASPPPAPHDPDLMRVGLAGFAAFILVCIIFTMFGGGAQSPGLIPVYWLGFFMLWRGLS